MSRTADTLGIVAENVVRGDEYWQLIDQAASAIVSQLSLHCGPSAGTTMIAFPGDPTAVGKFTADGITIVKQMTFSTEKNPVFEMVRQMAVSIGTEVDNVASDGTTTAMMLFATLLRNIARVRVSGEYHGYELREIIRESFATMRNRVTQLTRPASMDIIRRAVSLSCRGDDQVINATMNMIDRMPKDFLETYTTYMAGVDKHDGVRVSVDDNKYPLKAYVTAYGNPEQYLNDQFGMRFEDQSATVLFYNPIRFGHAPGSMLTYACSCIEGIFNRFFLAEDGSPLESFNPEAVSEFDNSFVIIAPYVSDITSYGFTSAKLFTYLGNVKNYWSMLDAINAINGALQSTNSTARIMLMSPVGGSRNNDDLLLKWLPMAVATTAEPYTADIGTVGYFVNNACVHYDGKHIRLGNLFGGHQINPQFSPTFMTETDDDSEYIKIIREMMRTVRMTNVTMADDPVRAQSAADEVMPMLMGMVMASTPRIVITGDIHSELHDQEVVRDAIGAAMAIINSGVISCPWYELTPLTHNISKDLRQQLVQLYENDMTQSVVTDAIDDLIGIIEVVSEHHPDFYSYDQHIYRSQATTPELMYKENDIHLPVSVKGVMTTLQKVEEFAVQIANSNSIILSNARVNLDK